MIPPRPPTREELLAAEGATLPDVIAPGLRVLFCGINPGLYTAAIQSHFGRPGNRFWRALYESGFTPRLFCPWEQRELLKLGLGITNVVARATNSAAELRPEDYIEGGRELESKVRELQPRWLAVLGIGAFRAAFGARSAQLGEQPERLGETRVWVLPNPSGLNAHFTPARLAALFAELRAASDSPQCP